MIYPTFEEFEKNFAAGKPQVVYAKQVNDLETPVSAMLKLPTGDGPRFTR